MISILQVRQHLDPLEKFPGRLTKLLQKNIWNKQLDLFLKKVPVFIDI